MKLVGITGTGTGKLGSSVFAVNSGVQIVRQYQPVVSNPSTDAQVEQRAKLKLMSQLARDLSAAIAIPKDGLVSSRNLFIKKNFGAITFEGNTAEAVLGQIKLTNGNISMAGTYGQYSNDGKTLNLNLDTNAYPSLDNVSVFVYSRDANNNLVLTFHSEVSSEDISDEGVVTLQSGSRVFYDDSIVYVYGATATSDKAKGIFGNMAINDSKTIAQLVATRQITSADVILTDTAKVYLTAQG